MFERVASGAARGEEGEGSGERAAATGTFRERSRGEKEIRGRPGEKKEQTQSSPENLGEQTQSSPAENLGEQTNARALLVPNVRKTRPRHRAVSRVSR